MSLDNCTLHENCQRSYPCAQCYDEDHPPPACGHRQIMFLSSLSCARHPMPPWPAAEPCPTCGKMIATMPMTEAR